MGRRRGSADNNAVSLSLKEGNPSLGFDLFTTDSLGNIAREAISTRDNLAEGLFKEVIKKFSFSFDSKSKAVFEKDDGTKPFFESLGDLRAKLQGETLTYTIEVSSEGEEFSYSFSYNSKEILADDDFKKAGINKANFNEELVNSLSSFSLLIDDVELNKDRNAFNFPGSPYTTQRRDNPVIFPSFATKDVFKLGFVNITKTGLIDLDDGDISFSVELYPEEDIDPVETSTTPQTLFGSSASEILKGGAAADNIFGNGGEDEISGEGGDDNLYGGNQADEISGGDDNDTLFGNEGANLLVGGDGDDTLYGGNQADNILGGAGNDTIYDNSGDDFIDSGSGLDLIRLGGGNDIVILSTGEGYDTIENYQLGMTTLKGFAQSDLDFVAKNGDTEIFKGSDQLAVVRWKTPDQLSSGLFAA